MLSVCKTSSAKCCRNRLSTQEEETPGVDLCRLRDELFQLVKQQRRCSRRPLRRPVTTRGLRATSTKGNDNIEWSQTLLFFAHCDQSASYSLWKNQPGGDSYKLLLTPLLKKSEALLEMCDDVVWEESLQFANRKLWAPPAKMLKVPEKVVEWTERLLSPSQFVIFKWGLLRTQTFSIGWKNKSAVFRKVSSGVLVY